MEFTPGPEYRDIITTFHAMWDGFPGPARLVRRDRIILAANRAAMEKGHCPGVCCASLPSETGHRGCMANRTLDEGKGHFDNPTGRSIRGWAPVAGRDDIFIHFTLAVPEKGEQGQPCAL